MLVGFIIGLVILAIVVTILVVLHKRQVAEDARVAREFSNALRLDAERRQAASVQTPAPKKNYSSDYVVPKASVTDSYPTPRYEDSYTQFDRPPARSTSRVTNNYYGNGYGGGGSNDMLNTIIAAEVFNEITESHHETHSAPQHNTYIDNSSSYTSNDYGSSSSSYDSGSSSSSYDSGSSFSSGDSGSF